MGCGVLFSSAISPCHPPALLLSPMPLGLMPGRLFLTMVFFFQVSPHPGHQNHRHRHAGPRGFRPHDRCAPLGLAGSNPSNLLVHSPILPHTPPYSLIYPLTPNKLVAFFVYFQSACCRVFLRAPKRPRRWPSGFPPGDQLQKHTPRFMYKWYPFNALPNQNSSIQKSPDVHKACVWEPIYLFCFFYTFKLRSAGDGLLPNAGRINMG